MHAEKEIQKTSLEVEPLKVSKLENHFHSNESIQCRIPDSDAIQKAEEKRPNSTGMPDRLKSGLENLSGYDLSDVRIHYNSPKPRQIGALAYTQGTNIHIGPGQHKHLPHEGWHVVQQMQGRVKPTLHLKGVAINDQTSLEKEADVMGLQAARKVEIKSPKKSNAHAQSMFQGPLTQKKSQIIQRNVGFEFEIPNCRAMEPTGLPVAGAAIGGVNAAINNNLVGYQPVPRHEPIMSGRGYRLEGEGTDAMPRIEFVTTDFAENSSGRKDLVNTLNSINWICGAIEHAHQNEPDDLILAGDLKRFWHIRTTIDHPHALVKGYNNISFKPQATAGIRLDRLSNLIESLGTGAKPDAEQAGRFALAGNGVIQIPNVSADIGPALGNYALDVRNVNNDNASAQMRSIVYLVALYIVKARVYATRPKYIAPFMMRTDFASTFNLLPERDTTFTPGNAAGRALWVQTCLEAAGLNPGDAGDRFLANIGDWTGLPVNADPNHLTLQQWLEGIYNGNDLFTQANYPVVAAQPDIESPGALGANMDATNKWLGRWGRGTPAPVLEFRMMRENIRRIVTEQALDVYDYIVAVNYAENNPPDLTFFHNRLMEQEILR